MVRVESGPCDGGMALCFFCTAMLGIELGIPMLSLKKPPSFLPFSSSSSSSSFELLFQDAFGSSLSKWAVQGTALCISCSFICVLQTIREKSMKTEHPVIPLSSGLEILKQGYPHRKCTPVSFKVVEVRDSDPHWVSSIKRLLPL